MDNFSHTFLAMCRAWRSRIARLRARGFRPAKPDMSKLRVPFSLFFHPLRTFGEIKYENKGSLPLAAAMTALFFVVQTLSATATDYLFRDAPADEADIRMIFLRSVGLVLLWAVCNWATCTLANGEGTMRDVFMMTSYSLTPYLLLAPVGVLLSYAFSLDEAVLWQAVQTVALLWTVLLLFFGMLTAHQFTVTKTLLSCLFTVIAIFFCCFLVILFFSIASQMVGSIGDLIMELSYR